MTVDFPLPPPLAKGSIIAQCVNVGWVQEELLDADRFDKRIDDDLDGCSERTGTRVNRGRDTHQFGIVIEDGDLDYGSVV